MKHLPPLLLAGIASLPFTAAAGTLTTLYTVPAVSEPSNPQAVTAFNGKLYGVTSSTVFQIAPRTGAVTTLHLFTGGADGAFASGAPVALDGKLYGTTFEGGAANTGIAYQIDPATGGYTKTCDLPQGVYPGLISLTPFRGALYGIGQRGGLSNENGTIYRVDPTAQTCTVVYAFAGGKSGANPEGAMAAEGNFLFGTTANGGTADRGTLFKFNPNTQTLTIKHSFTGADIAYPSTALTVANGTIYGAGASGGANKNGGIFAFDSQGENETIPYNFPSGKASVPISGLTSENGLLYGLAGDSAVSAPYLYAIDPGTGALSTVFTFTFAGFSNGTGLTIGEGGLLYGAYANGGASGLGGVFSVDPSSGAETIVHTFAGNSIAEPSALINVGGALYGTAVGSGAAGLGSIFKVLPGKAQGQTLYSFTGPDGAYPKSALLDAGGLLYGTTTAGGPKNGGTLFSFDPATRTLTTLASLNFSTSGFYSPPALVQIGNILYGITRASNAVFQFDLTRMKLSTLASVSNPVSGLIAGGGLLYGTIAYGGPYSSGSLFQLDPASAALTTLFNFQTSDSAVYPTSGLLYDAGALFGFTAGSTKIKAAAFRFDLATGTFTRTHSFAAYTRFDAPPIALGTKLYAPLESSTSDPTGALLRLNQQTGATGTLYSFTGGADGSYPATSLLHILGHFYGTTSGGPNGSRDGTVFSYRP